LWFRDQTFTLDVDPALGPDPQFFPAKRTPSSVVEPELYIFAVWNRNRYLSKIRNRNWEVAKEK
jgi:hypothetical protein